MANNRLKIITINIPKIYLGVMAKVQEHYNSRSEMMRVALREFLIKELEFNSKLTGEDHQDFIRVVRETPTTVLTHQKKPIGNSYYLDNLGMNEEVEKYNE